MTNQAKIQKILSAVTANELPWGSAFADKMLTATWHQTKGWGASTIRPYSSIPLLPAASVFHYGMAVFDGLKAYSTPKGPAIFRPDLHLERMNHSAQRVSLPALPEAIQPMLLSYTNEIRDWIPPSPPSALYLRIVLFATEPRLGVRPSSSALLVVMASPVGSFFPRPPMSHQRGLKLLADPRYYRASVGGLGSCKAAANYATSMMPAQQASENGFDQMLWLSDPHTRNVTEVGMMNIFFVFNLNGKRTLVTPRLDGTFLNGITRRSIISMAQDASIDTEERDVPISEVFSEVRSGNIVEIFGSGTAALVCPVYSIDYGEEKIELNEQEHDGDLGLLFRRKLIAIYSLDSHPWMLKLDDGEKATLLKTDAALTEADI